MTLPEMPKSTGLRTALGIVAAFAGALAVPLFLGMSSFAFPFPILAAVIFAFAGAVPAALYVALTVASFGVFFGGGASLLSAAAFAVPSACVLRGLRFRRPFLSQMRVAVVTQIVCSLAALFFAYLLVGSDLVGALMKEVRLVADALPNGVKDELLNLFFSIEEGADPALLNLAEGFLEAERRAYFMDELFKRLYSYFALTAPGMILSASAMTGILAVSFAGGILKRRLREESTPAFIPLRDWFVPWKFSVGLIAMMAVSCVLYLLGVGSAEVVSMTVQMLLMSCFRVAAVISLNRRFSQMRMPAWGRVILILLALLALGEYLSFYGAFSALFGTRGAMKQIQEWRMKKQQ